MFIFIITRLLPLANFDAKNIISWIYFVDPFTPIIIIYVVTWSTVLERVHNVTGRRGVTSEGYTTSMCLWTKEPLWTARPHLPRMPCLEPSPPELVRLRFPRVLQAGCIKCCTCFGVGVAQLVDPWSLCGMTRAQLRRIVKSHFSNLCGSLQNNVCTLACGELL